ncbi:MAG: type I methionyl aminopeptidase [Planctomycetota bacterium]|jgi:methionyl aminopeptidase
MVAGPILKSAQEIEEMRPACRIVADCLAMLETMVRPGVCTLELDQAAETLVRDRGAEPAFLGYPSGTQGVASFPGTICASINEEVVHGIPSSTRVLAEGDIISIDVGAKLNGFFGDAARTFPVGEVSKRLKKLLKVGEESLRAAIKTLRPGVPLNRVSRAVQMEAEKHHYAVVRQFVGHGIGREMHEPPQVPNFVSKNAEGKILLGEGTVLAIEPMLNAGTHEVAILEDGWTVVTADRKASVHFEDTVAIGPNGPMILTA